jgi:N-acetylneuraminic acid mutarotase
VKLFDVRGRLIRNLFEGVASRTSFPVSFGCERSPSGGIFLVRTTIGKVTDQFFILKTNDMVQTSQSSANRPDALPADESIKKGDISAVDILLVEYLGGLLNQRILYSSIDTGITISCKMWFSYDSLYYPGNGDTIFGFYDSLGSKYDSLYFSWPLIHPGSWANGKSTSLYLSPYSDPTLCRKVLSSAWKFNAKPDSGFKDDTRYYWRVGIVEGADSIFSPVKQFHFMMKDVFIPKARMPLYRKKAGAGAIGGSIYVCGGTVSVSPDAVVSISKSMEIYNTVTDTWQTGPEMIAPRNEFQCVVINNKLYAIGGEGMIDSTIESFNPATAEWTLECVIPPSARTFRGEAVAIGSNIYRLGGDRNESNSDMVWKYSVADGTWEQKMSMRTPRKGFSPVVVNNRIYTFGGTYQSGVSTWTEYKTVEVYDPENDTWSIVDSMPGFRDGQEAAVCGSKIYLLGGGTGTGSSNTPVYDIWIYSAADKSWATSKAVIATKETFFAGRFSGISIVSMDKTIYAIGGGSGGYQDNYVTMYRPRD